MKRFPLFICLLLLSLLVIIGIPLAAASPTVTGISPISGSKGSYIDVTITGTGFTSATIPYMYKCAVVSGSPGSQPKFAANSYRLVSGTQITATFSLGGDYKVGDYSVAVFNPQDGSSDWGWGYKENIFHVYSGSSGTTTTKTTTETTTVTTYATPSEGDNSVFFETEPTGTTIYLDGTEIGTSAFTYYTNRDGTYDVVVKKIGFEDYEAKVTILEGKRVHFYAPLTIQSSSGTPTVTRTTTGKSVTTAAGVTGKTVTTTRKSTLTIPTPLGPDPPPSPEESPVDPATALWAAALGTAVVVIRRR
jgi:PEGA domain